MKITITIEDQENGMVRFTADPEIEKIIAQGKNHASRKPSEAYALVALSAMVGYSGQLEKEKRGLTGFVRTRLSH